MGASEKAAAEADLKALKEAIERAPIDQITDDQIADIKAAKEKLMNTMQPIAQKVYEQAQASAGAQGTSQAGPAPESSDGGASDGYVDGDFKEV